MTPPPKLPHQNTVPQEKKKFIKRGPKLEVDCKYTNFCWAPDHPPPPPHPPALHRVWAKEGRSIPPERAQEYLQNGAVAVHSVGAALGDPTGLRMRQLLPQHVAALGRHQRQRVHACGHPKGRRRGGGQTCNSRKAGAPWSLQCRTPCPPAPPLPSPEKASPRTDWGTGSDGHSPGQLEGDLVQLSAG